MPTGIQRLNARHQPPTPHIIFIKPLPGSLSDVTTATEFLSRVAAICHPILKAHHLSVMSLEEFPPNREFIGRNFNAGECIQLVLRTHSGAWMSFRSVVMVMIHELAHCEQMNHSRAFWKVRNGMAEDMRALWARGYTGEGVWGPGRQMMSGVQLEGGSGEGDMPEHVCGGTFRSRGRGGKRKRRGERESLTYAERQQRRIAKKFGTSGLQLGGEEKQRIKLERGKKIKAKPRVAGSMRGRELRAQAALARLGDNGDVKKEERQTQLGLKKEENTPIKEEYMDSESEEDYDDPQQEAPGALDVDGTELHDSKGRSMVKVCEDEDQTDVYVKSEMQELQALDQIPLSTGSNEVTARGRVKTPRPSPSTSTAVIKEELSPDQADISTDSGLSESDGVEQNSDRLTSNPLLSAIKREPSPETHELLPASESQVPSNPDFVPSPQLPCSVCSLANSSGALLCECCSNVLRPSKAPGHWQCKSDVCKESQFINSGDFGRCAVCGGPKGV